MKKSSNQNLVNEAIEFSKTLKADLDNPIFKHNSDQNKIRCVEFIKRGLSLGEVSAIFGVPKSSLCGWKFRVESSNCDTPLKSGDALVESEKMRKALDINKLVEVHVTKASSSESITEPNIEFKISNTNLNLAIKNLNLLSAKELMKEYIKCLSMKEI
jgi:hypothetical protein